MDVLLVYRRYPMAVLKSENDFTLMMQLKSRFNQPQVYLQFCFECLDVKRPLKIRVVVRQISITHRLRVHHHLLDHN